MARQPKNCARDASSREHCRILQKKKLLRDPGGTKGVARVEPRWEDGIFLGVSDPSGHRERHAQGSNSQTSRGHRTS